MTDEAWIGAGMIAVFVGLIGWAIWDHNKWLQYAKDHHCRRTGAQHSYTSFRSQYCGKGRTVIVPYTVTSFEYACDAGEYLWR